jgi:hypothetical protein
MLALAAFTLASGPTLSFGRVLITTTASSALPTHIVRRVDDAAILTFTFGPQANYFPSKVVHHHQSVRFLC